MNKTANSYLSKKDQDFFDKIMSTPTISFEEEKLLYPYIKTDSDARNKVISNHYAMAMKQSHAAYSKNLISGVSLADLFSVAALGLMRAADKFNPDAGTKFITYATPTVRSQLLNYLIANSKQKKIEQRAKDIYKSKQHHHDYEENEFFDEDECFYSIEETELETEIETETETEIEIEIEIEELDEKNLFASSQKDPGNMVEDSREKIFMLLNSATGSLSREDLILVAAGYNTPSILQAEDILEFERLKESFKRDEKFLRHRAKRIIAQIKKVPKRNTFIRNQDIESWYNLNEKEAEKKFIAAFTEIGVSKEEATSLYDFLGYPLITGICKIKQHPVYLTAVNTAYSSYVPQAKKIYYRRSFYSIDSFIEEIESTLDCDK